MVARLPAEEDRLRAYTRLLRERFGEEPKEINEGASIVPAESTACLRCAFALDLLGRCSIC